MRMNEKNKWISKEVISTILTFLLCIAIGLILATVFTFVFEINEYFWTITLVGILVMVVTNLIWLPTGREKGLNNTTVKSNTRIWNSRADYIVNNQMFDVLKKFCDNKNEAHKKQLIIDRLEKVSLNYNVYEQIIKYNILFDKKYEISDKKEKTEEEKFKDYISTLNKQQIKILKALKNKEIKFEKLSSKDITIGKNATKGIVPHNRENKYLSFLLLAKILWGFGLGCFMAFIVISPTEFGMAQGVQAAVWFFSIIYNVWASINSGQRAIVIYRNAYMIEQAELCAEFFAYANVKVKEVDESIVKAKEIMDENMAQPIDNSE